MSVTFREWDDSDSARRAAVSLGRDEVQVWTAAVPTDEAELHELARLLSADERQRAEKFTVSGPRRQYVFGRAWLRQLLGACLAVGPVALVFDCHPRGKPRLSQAVRKTDVRFNLSHSGRRVVVALARGREVGVDLELIQPWDDWPLLAERVFSPRELAELRSLPQSQQPAAFFHGWTRKEAWLKATGEGLTDALAAIEVTLAPGKPPEWLALPGGPPAVRRWALRDLPLPVDFAGAVVFENVEC
jgi:4'-phosphopantetheinyl transferase